MFVGLAGDGWTVTGSMPLVCQHVILATREIYTVSDVQTSRGL